MLIQPKPIGGGSGATTFTGLTDTPASIIARQYLVGNSAGNALVFRDAGWVDVRDYGVVGDGVSNDYDECQNAIIAAGENKVIFFPPNLKYNLNGNMLYTTAIGQTLLSFSRALRDIGTYEAASAELLNGGLQIDHRSCGMSGFNITGAGTYGLDFNAGLTLPSDWSTAGGGFFGEYIFIRDKTIGINMDATSGRHNISHIRMRNNTTGLLIDYTDAPAEDAGDMYFSDWDIIGGTTGIHLVKVGGLRLVNIKSQSATDVGLLVEATTAATGLSVSGLYLANCTFENAANWDVKITAQAGVAAARYPRNIQLTGVHWQKMLLDKVDYVEIAGGSIGFDTVHTIQQNVDATNVMTMGLRGAKLRRTGAGTSYIDVGMDSTNGAYIQSGGVLKLYDSSFPSGKTLSQLHTGT